MTTALIIGSGAAAAGAALALSHRENLKITVIDIRFLLESDREQLVEALISSSPDERDEQTIELISQQPVASRNSVIPEKRIFGSDYPFRNVGQFGGLTAVRCDRFSDFVRVRRLQQCGAPGLCLLQQQHLRTGL